MAGNSTPRRWRPGRAGAPGTPRQRTAQRAARGPWSWPWRHRRRRRRAFGCFLWLVTLLFVLLVLSILFGGWRRGAATGTGPAHLAASVAAAATPARPIVTGPGR